MGYATKTGMVEKGRQLRSRAFSVLTFSVYAPRAKSQRTQLAACFNLPRLRGIAHPFASHDRNF